MTKKLGKKSGKSKKIFAQIIIVGLGVALCGTILFYQTEINSRENTIEKLWGRNNKLNNRLSRMEENIQEKQKIIENLERTIKNKEDRIKILKKEYSDVKNNLEKLQDKINLENPTKNQVKKLLNNSDIDKREYVPVKHDCDDFANELIDLSIKQGIMAHALLIEGRRMGHVMVAYNTPSGWVYVEPQTDQIYNETWLRKQEPYDYVII